MAEKIGIDVSEFQGDIDWKRVKESGVEFAILRAGYGREVSQKDKKFERNYTGCTANKIPCGVYWFSYALTAEDAVREADACYEVIKGKHFDYPVFFDIENNNQYNLGAAAVSGIINAFCQRLASRNYLAGVYSYKNFLETRTNDYVKENYPVWVAHTGVAKTDYAGQYGIWQYAQGVPYAGISSVDLDKCCVDYTAEPV